MRIPEVGAGAGAGIDFPTEAAAAPTTSIEAFMALFTEVKDEATAQAASEAYDGLGLGRQRRVYAPLFHRLYDMENREEFLRLLPEDSDLADITESITEEFVKIEGFFASPEEYEFCSDPLKEIINAEILTKFRSEPDECEALLAQLPEGSELGFALEACKRIAKAYPNDLIVSNLRETIAFVKDALALEAGEHQDVDLPFSKIPRMFGILTSEGITRDDISKAEQMLAQCEVVYSHASRIPKLKEKIDRIVGHYFQDLHKVMWVRVHIANRGFQTDSSSAALRFLTRFEMRNVLQRCFGKE